MLYNPSLRIHKASGLSRTCVTSCRLREVSFRRCDAPSSIGSIRPRLRSGLSNDGSIWCRELHNAASKNDGKPGRQASRSASPISPGNFPVSRSFARVRRCERPVLQQALHRVDLAFKAFFRRAKSGENPGYPRFKSRDRYQSPAGPRTSDLKWWERSISGFRAWENSGINCTGRSRVSPRPAPSVAKPEFGTPPLLGRSRVSEGASSRAR